MKSIQRFEEGRVGVEPTRDGFAIRCLSHLAIPPKGLNGQIEQSLTLSLPCSFIPNVSANGPPSFSEIPTKNCRNTRTWKNTVESPTDTWLNQIM